MIGRRQLVGWGALGLGAFAIDGCGPSLPWGKAATAQPEDVEHLLRQLDQVVLQLKSLEPDIRRFGINPDSAFVAEGSATCKRLLIALCLLGTYRDVPQAFWQQPAIEQRLAETLPKIYETLRLARTYLGSMTDDVGTVIENKLRDDPEMTMRIMERIDDYAKQVHVPVELRTYLRGATAQLAGRFRFEGAKEVTSKLVIKWDRAFAARQSELGMQGDLAADAGGDEKPQPMPIRVQFRTRASASEVHVATCALEPKITIAGVDRQMVLDWEESRCPTSSPARPSDDQPLVHAAVRAEPREGGESLVTFVVYPPPGVSEDSVIAGATVVAQHLRSALSVSTAPPPPAPAPRLGAESESCRSRADCEPQLECSRGACRNEDETLPRSARLIKTTGQVAKWGAIFLIPPICAIGALVLLTCLFMVIVAGCMYAGGD